MGQIKISINFPGLGPDPQDQFNLRLHKAGRTSPVVSDRITVPSDGVF